GCCTGTNGQCVTGDTNTACGTNGGYCAMCGGFACIAGVWTPLPHAAPPPHAPLAVPDATCDPPRVRGRPPGGPGLCAMCYSGPPRGSFNPCTPSDLSRCMPDEYCANTINCTATGLCLLRPVGCCYPENAVCGCDGNAYRNSCEAIKQGVSVVTASQ